MFADLLWHTRFEAFAARKTREAEAAELPAYETEVDDAGPSDEDIGNPWTQAHFDGDFHVSPLPADRRPACNLVFVQSRNGNTVAPNPLLLGGGLTDKHLIYEGLSRVAADAVLGGAETIRGGQILLSIWHPQLVALRESLGKPRHPTQIVATLQGVDVEHGLLFNVPSVPVILITIGQTATLMERALADRPWIKAVVMSRPSELGDAFAELRSLGIERISCIGGRRIATQLIDAGLVQDVYLTTSPRDGGEPNTPMYPGPLKGRVVVRKRGTEEESGVVFEHIVLP